MKTWRIVLSFRTGEERNAIYLIDAETLDQAIAEAVEAEGLKPSWTTGKVVA